MDIRLTEGKVSETLLKFALPILASEMVQRICILADNMIAGKCINGSGLAAIGSVYPITVVFTSIALGLSSGGAVIISQLFGKKDYISMRIAISTMLLSGILISIVMGTIGFAFSEKFIILVNISEDLKHSALIYLQVYMISFIFRFLYSICTAIFIALGNSKLAFFCLVISSTLNIALDIVTVLCFQLGIFGIGIAALLAQFIMAFITVSILIKRVRGFDEQAPTKHFSKEMFSAIGKLCTPNILMQVIMASGDVYMLRIINNYGVEATTGYTAGLQLNMFFFTCLIALGNGIASYTAQNIGAESVERVKKGLKVGIVMSMCIALPFFLLFILFPQKFLYFFLDEKDTASLMIGIIFLRLTTPFYIVVCIKQLLDGVLRGAGAMLYPMGITIIDLLQRVVLVNILKNYYGLSGVFITFPTGWIISMVLYCIFFYRGVWYKKIRNTSNKRHDDISIVISEEDRYE